MRLEHWFIVTALGLLVSSVIFGLKYKLQDQIAYTRFCYNQMVDSALEDGLMEGIENSDGAYPEVNEETALMEFKKSLLKSFDVSEESDGGRRLMDCLKCILIIQNRYVSVYYGNCYRRMAYETKINGWDIRFYLDGEICARNNKTGELLTGDEKTVRGRIGYWEGYTEGESSAWMSETVSGCVDTAMEQALKEKTQTGSKYSVNFPIVEEDWCHSIKGVSMISFFDCGAWYLDGELYTRYFLSGARVVHTEQGTYVLCEALCLYCVDKSTKV